MAKKIICMFCILLFSYPAFSGDAYEIVLFKYKNGISFKKQKNATKQLGNIIKGYDGFKSRKFYYSKEKQGWVDVVVWSSLIDAKNAAAKAMKNPEAGKIFSQIVFSHYDLIGELK